MKPTEQRPKFFPRVRRLGSAGIAITTAAIALKHSTLDPRPSTPPKTPPPLPRTQWPALAEDIAQERQPTDKGIGDTIVHIIGNARSKKFKEWFEEHIGESCGCTDRKDWLNARYPYAATAPTPGALPAKPSPPSRAT